MTYTSRFFNPVSSATSSGSATLYVNNSGSLIAKATPVSATGGTIQPTDVASEASFLAFLGLMFQDTANATSGPILSTGRLLNVSLSGFTYGDPVYVGPGGTLTNLKPDIGVDGFTAGDWVIFVGVVVENEANPANLDIQLNVNKIGRL